MASTSYDLNQSTVFTNPSKGSTQRSNPNAIYVGIVSSVVGNQVIVKIPKLNPIAEIGPCDVYCDIPEVGEFVICSYIDNRFEHIVVIGKKYLGVSGQETMSMEVFS